MNIFGSVRGGFRAIELDASKGSGVQVSVAGGGSAVGSSSLVTSFSVAQAESYAVAKCLNGGVFLYAFGHDPQQSSFSLGVTSFLHGCDGNVGSDLEAAISAYRAGRVSQSKELSSMTVGNTPFRRYLIGQSVDIVDTQLSIIQTNYTFIALDAH